MIRNHSCQVATRPKASLVENFLIWEFHTYSYSDGKARGGCKEV